MFWWLTSMFHSRVNYIIHPFIPASVHLQLPLSIFTGKSLHNSQSSYFLLSYEKQELQYECKVKNIIHKTHCKIISRGQQSKVTLSGNKSQCEKVDFPKLLWSFYSLNEERERTPKHRSLITNSSVPQDQQCREGMNSSPVSEGEWILQWTLWRDFLGGESYLIH